MQSFGHILFPVDFSARCQAARPAVASWAERFHANVTLLHTIHIPISAYGGPDGYPVMIDVPAIEGAAKDRLNRFEMVAGRRVIAMGDPAYEIVQYAEKNDVDLIMMPTHGYGKFRSLLLGSTAAKVLHDAHCPVWTSAHTEDLPKSHEIHSILCAIETGPEASSFSGRRVSWRRRLAQNCAWFTLSPLTIRVLKSIWKGNLAPPWSERAARRSAKFNNRRVRTWRLGWKGAALPKCFAMRRSPMMPA